MKWDFMVLIIGFLLGAWHQSKCLFTNPPPPPIERGIHTLGIAEERSVLSMPVLKRRFRLS